MEKNILDRFFQGYLLGKRKVWKPLKSYIRPPNELTRLLIIYIDGWKE
jgi:hypothetical protein